MAALKKAIAPIIPIAFHQLVSLSRPIIPWITVITNQINRPIWTASLMYLNAKAIFDPRELPKATSLGWAKEDIQSTKTDTSAIFRSLIL